MDREKAKGIIEAILFSTGRIVKTKELMSILELGEDEIISLLSEMIQEYQAESRGIEIIRVNDGYQLSSKKNIMNTYILHLTKEQHQHYHKRHLKY